MAHYPIKCVRCSYTCTNREVLFDTSDTTIDMTDQLRNDDEEVAAESEGINLFGDEDTGRESSAETFSFWDEPEPEVTVRAAADKPKEESVRLAKHMTLPQIEAYCAENGLECEQNWQDVHVTPDFAARSAGTDDRLLVSVAFQKEKGHAKIQATRRLCPKCKCELPRQSGSMPTYNITVMGTSASGKTVYLCALNYMLMNSMGKLPYSSSLTCVSASRANTDLVNKSAQLFNEGILPGTTQIVFTEPMVIQMSYTLNGTTKKCLVSMSDMRGEDFVAASGENLLAKAKFFAKADAFLILVSPLNMPCVSSRIPGLGGEECNTNVHGPLMTNISEYILPNFVNNEIKAPSAVMLSKSDVLMRYREYLQIRPSNPVVAAEPPVKYTGSYFRNHHNGTADILKGEPTLFNFLNNTFRNVYYSSFSSLGPQAKVNTDENQNKVVENKYMIRPVRVIDSMIYLLMRLGFLPEFFRMEAGPAYEKQNIEILKNWISSST